MVFVVLCYRTFLRVIHSLHSDVQKAAAGRSNSIITNRDVAKRHVDRDLITQTPAWMDKWGPQIVAEHLTRSPFKCPDWYLDVLLVRFPSLLPPVPFLLCPACTELCADVEFIVRFLFVSST